jgi:hypothetical protein
MPISVYAESNIRYSDPFEAALTAADWIEISWRLRGNGQKTLILNDDPPTLEPKFQGKCLAF